MMMVLARPCWSPGPPLYDVVAEVVVKVRVREQPGESRSLAPELISILGKRRLPQPWNDWTGLQCGPSNCLPQSVVRTINLRQSSENKKGPNYVNEMTDAYDNGPGGRGTEETTGIASL